MKSCPKQALSITKQAFASLLSIHSPHPNQLKQIHGLLLTTGISIKNSLITQLLTSLTVLGDMPYARQLFDEMHKPRAYQWNTLIKGYAKNEMPTEAAAVYWQMHALNVRPDPFTYPFVVKACAELSDSRVGVAVHVHVLKHGLEFVSMVRTELMVMYVKFGDVDSSDYLFDSMVEKDLVAWNALIAAYAQNGLAVNAVRLFGDMSDSGVRPDAVTVVSTSQCDMAMEINIYLAINGSVKERIRCCFVLDSATSMSPRRPHFPELHRLSIMDHTEAQDIRRNASKNIVKAN
ncbi:hypothetical protein RJ639_043471 [Escallonia herrerae]|uniref:Pentatricopeptide repeat-containing protein n=1 Tax=Escallonia herrerae TaxID=1293975 RepID=A0AA89B1F7_9ASTE|nr:hypothetical protein RJ639_043471 [Escallonia herrerae]